jgi:ABC-2 type transport system ATP-binding protein
VAIIHQGRLVANGSLDELRAGVVAAGEEKLTLEEMFLKIVGGEEAEDAAQELSWLA